MHKQISVAEAVGWLKIDGGLQFTESALSSKGVEKEKKNNLDYLRRFINGLSYL